MGLHAIGKIHFANNDFKTAISHYQLSLVVYKTHFGPDHLKTNKVMFDLAFAQHERQQYDKALGIYSNVMRTLNKNPDENHVEIAYTLHNMGLSHAGKGDYKTAIQCFEKSLNIHKEDNVDEHNDATQSQGRYVVNISDATSVSSENSSVCLDVTDILSNLVLSYSEAGNLTKSIDYFERLIDFLHSKNPDSIELADAYQTLGEVFFKNNIFDRASTCYTDAYKIRKAKVKDSRLYESDYLNSMGVLYLKQEDDEEAMGFFQQALRIRKQCLSDTHEKVADTYVNIGQTFKNFLLYDEALDCYKTSLSIYQEKYGLNHSKVADLLYNIAIVQANTGHYSHSIKVFEKVFMIYKEFESTVDQPRLLNIVEWIAYLREFLFLSPDNVAKIKRRSSMHI